MTEQLSHITIISPDRFLIPGWRNCGPRGLSALKLGPKCSWWGGRKEESMTCQSPGSITAWIHLQLFSASPLFIPQTALAFDEFQRRRLFGIFNQMLRFLNTVVDGEWQGLISHHIRAAVSARPSLPTVWAGPPVSQSRERCFPKETRRRKMSDCQLPLSAFYGPWYLSEENN